MTVTSTTQTGYTQYSAKTTSATWTNESVETASSQARETQESATTYVWIQEEIEEHLTTQQEIEIKQQATQSANETKESPLATAIKESAQAKDTNQTKATGRMAEMIEKYKDVYTPMPEKFSQEIEDLQTALIRERYPDYLTIDEVLERYAVPVESPTPEAEAKAKVLQEAKRAESLRTEGPNIYNGGVPYVRDEEREAFIASIMRQHPNNTQDKHFGNLTNSSERARTYNAAVYEGLEAGENLVDASAMASEVQNTYVDNSEMFDEQFRRTRAFFHEYYDEVDRRAEQERQNMLKDPLPDQNPLGKYDGTVLDLRKFGFDRDITTLSLFKTNAAMVTSIQEQIKFFDFILENQGTVKIEYDKLKESYRLQNSFDVTVIAPVKTALPIAERAFEVFSKYEIYDK